MSGEGGDDGAYITRLFFTPAAWNLAAVVAAAVVVGAPSARPPPDLSEVPPEINYPARRGGEPPPRVEPLPNFGTP